MVAMFAAGTSLKAQEITITLWPGCTWISYPNAEAMSITTAMGDFTPMEGDIIKSQSTSSVYSNGGWVGGVTQFTPGCGYKYYSKRTEAVNFVFVQSSDFSVTTSEPTDINGTSAVAGGIVTIGEKSVIPDGITVGKNSVIFGETTAADYENSYLASGKTLIKAGEE